MVLQDISEFITQTSIMDIPEETKKYSKSLILSCIGGSIAGAVMPAGRILSTYLKEKGGAQEAGVIGCRFRCPAADAALANGATAHGSELEDDSFPECCVMYSLIPAALALGEKHRLSGKEIIESIVVGYDVQAKICLAADIPWARGFAGFTMGWGSAACSAKLLNLNASQTVNAMSLCADLLSGWARQTGSMAHLLEAGTGAGNGVFAALMAKEGFTGAPDIFEIKGGIWDTLHFPREGLGRIPDLLAERPFRAMEVGIKTYPCCYIEQRIIDGALDLKEKEDISWEDIEHVEIHVGPYFPTLVHYPDPKNAEEARFSIEHSIVAAFLEERLFLEAYTDEKALDPTYKKERQKVEVVVHEDWPPGVIGGVDEVHIKLKEGKVHIKKCEMHKGDPPQYLTEDEVAEKFRRCTEFAGFLSTDQIEYVVDAVFNLDKVMDISRIMEVVTFAR